MSKILEAKPNTEENIVYKTVSGKIFFLNLILLAGAVCVYFTFTNITYYLAYEVTTKTR